MKPDGVKDNLKFSEMGIAGKEETPIQKANRLGVPLIPKKPPFSKTIADLNPIIAVCEECGHEIRAQNMKSCPLSNCPFGGKVTLN